MSEAVILAIITMIGGLLSGGAAVAWINRKKVKAETEVTLASEAMDIMQRTLDSTLNPLYRRIDDLEAREETLAHQVTSQAKSLDELNAKFTKLQLAFVVNESYIRSLGYKPPIALRDLDSLSTYELRDIAATMRNIERRRQHDYRPKDQDTPSDS